MLFFLFVIVHSTIGTPPGLSNTPPQSPLLGQRIQRSNSACISKAELPPCKYNTKLINKRRNTQLLLQPVDALDAQANSVHYVHRLQSEL